MNFSSSQPTRGFTVLEALIAVVLLSLAAGFVIVKFGGVKERAYIDAQKNDLQNLALSQEQYFVEHQRYGHPDTLAAQDFFSYSDNVQLDSLDISSPQDWWYARTRHTKTDVKCELLFRSQDEVSDIAQRIVCPGAGSGDAGTDTNSDPDADFTVTGPTTTASDLSAQFDFNADQAGGPIGSFAKSADLVFDGAASSDPDGDELVRFDWSFGGTGGVEVISERGQGVQVSNRWRSSGQFDVTLTVEDEHGATASVTKTLELVNKPPTARISLSTQQPVAGEPVEFDGSGSTDPNNDIESYTWEIDDGSGGVITATSQRAEQSFTGTGSRDVQLVVVDSEGAADTATASLSLTASGVELTHWWDPCTSAQQDANELIDIVGSHNLTLESDGSVSDWTQQWSKSGIASLKVEKSKNIRATTGSSVISGGDQPFTLLMLVKNARNIPNDREALIFHDGDASSRDWWLFYAGSASNPELQLRTNTGGGLVNFNRGPSPTGDWNVVAIRAPNPDGRYDVELLVNGDKRGSSINNSLLELTAGERGLSFMHHIDGVDHGFDGELGGILLFEGLLSDSELQAKSNELLNATCSFDGELLANFTWSPQPATAGTNIEFDASSTQTASPTAPVASYEWDFSDPHSTQTTATGVKPTHTFPQEGAYDVQLVVTDTEGRVDSLTRRVEVQSSAGELVAWWRACESQVAEDTLRDVIGGTDLTLTSGNGSVSDWSTVWKQGQRTYLDLDGGASRIEADIDNIFEPADTDFTLFALINTAPHLSRPETLIQAHSSGGANWGLDFVSRDQNVQGSHGRYSISGRVQLSGEWTVLALKVDNDAGIVQVFQDGQSLGQDSISTRLDVNGGRFFDNGTTTANRWLAGRVASIQYVRGQLTAGDIQERSQRLFDFRCPLTNTDLRAAFKVDPRPLHVGEGGTFDAGLTQSTHPITSYEWSLGDGTTDSGEQISHSYDSPDSYAVELVVTDSTGAQDTALDTLSVTRASGNTVSWWQACSSENTNTFVDVIGGHDLQLTSENGAITDWDSAWAESTRIHLELDGGTSQIWADGNNTSFSRTDQHFTLFYTLQLQSSSGGSFWGANASSGANWSPMLTNSGQTIDDYYGRWSPISGLQTGSWTTIALQFDNANSEVAVWQDGTQVGSASYSGSLDLDDPFGFFGRSADNFLSGNVSNVKYVEGELTGSEIATHSQDLLDFRCRQGDLDARFDVFPESPVAEGFITFDASPTFHAEPIENFQWDFGDSSTETTPNDSTEHTFSEPGSYTVQLVAQDTTGRVDTTTQTIEVQPTAQVVAWWDPCESINQGGTEFVDVAGNHTATLKSHNGTVTTGSTSSDPPGTPVLSYRADQLSVNDGSSVNSWPNSGSFSGGDLPLAQGVAPTYRADGLDGQPVVEFADGNTQWFELTGVSGLGAAFSSNEQLTIAGVIVPQNTGETTRLFELFANGFQGAWMGMYSSLSSTECNNGSGFRFASHISEPSSGFNARMLHSNNPAAGTAYSLVTTYDTNLTIPFTDVNGVSENCSASGGSATNGWNRIRVGSQNAAQMKVAEWHVYDGTWSSTELNAWKDYVSSKYPSVNVSGSSTTWSDLWTSGDSNNPSYLDVEYDNRVWGDLGTMNRSAESWMFIGRFYAEMTGSSSSSSDMPNWANVMRAGSDPMVLAWSTHTNNNNAGFWLPGGTNLEPNTNSLRGGAWHSVALRVKEISDGQYVRRAFVDGSPVGGGDTTSSVMRWQGQAGLFTNVPNFGENNFLDARVGSMIYYEGVASDSLIQAKHDQLMNGTGCASSGGPDGPEGPVASAQAQPTTASTGTTVEFNGSESFDPDGTIQAYEWDFGDGTTGGGELTTHTYSTSADYTAQLVVRDNAGLEDTAQVSVSMGEATPISVDLTLTDTLLDLESARDSFEAIGERSDGARLNLSTKLIAPDGTNTTHPNCQLTDVASPAICEGDLFHSQTGIWTAETTGSASGVASATVTRDYRVTDLNYSCSADVGVFSIEGVTCEDQNGDKVCTLEEEGGTDSEIGPAAQWTFDAQASNPNNLTATLQASGNNDTFLATGNSGARSWEISNPSLGTTPHTGQGDPQGVEVLIDDEVLKVLMPRPPNFTDSWNFTYYLYGDDTQSNAFAAAAINYTCDQDTPSDPSSPPNADFTYTPQSPQTDETVSFDASSSSDSDGTIESYDWDFGDGALGSEVAADHSYSDDGSFSVTLSVIDNDGNTDQATKTINVGNQAPSAEFTFTPDQMGPGVDVRFDASGSSDPDGSIDSYSWNFGDGVSGTGSTPTHSYSSPGVKDVQLTVADNDGATGQVTRSLTVLDPLNTTLSLSSTDIASGSTGESLTATGEQPQGVQINLDVDITKPDGTTVNGCQNSGSAPVSCNAALPTDQDGQYQVQATTSADNFQNHTTSQSYEVGTLQYTCSSWTLQDGSDIDGDSPGQTRSDISYEFRVPNTDPANLKILTWAEVPLELGTNEDDAWVMEGTALQNIPGGAADSWETWEPARPGEGTQSQAASGTGDREPSDLALPVREPTCDPGQLEGQCGRRVEILLPEITDQSGPQTLVYHIEARYGDSVNDPPEAEKNFRVEISCSDEVQ